MSARAKGRRTLNKSKEYYEELGYLVDEVEKTGKFRKEKDLFGLFDLIAIDKDKTLLIQVKTNTPATQKHYKKFAKEYANKTREVHVYTWYDYSGERIQNYLKNGKIIERDHRK